MCSSDLLIEDGGAALAPLMAGIIAANSSLSNAILTICITAWILGTIFLGFTSYLVPRDIATLRAQMKERAEAEKQTQAKLAERAV